MATDGRNPADVKLAGTIGLLLRAGVMVAAALAAIGGALYLLSSGSTIPTYHQFHGQPAELRSITGTIAAALHGGHLAIMQLGILALIATPVLRVALSLVGFALERDWVYVLCTAIVLAVLAFSLTGARF